MKFLLYYKIEGKDKKFYEGNWYIETVRNKPTYEELQDFFRKARDKWNTHSRPIIINMFELN